MLQNKYVIWLIVVIVIAGIFIITKANFGARAGLGGQSASFQVGADA